MEERTTHLKNDTEALGMSKDRKVDLHGYILSPEEIEQAVIREWTLLGIDVREDLRCVKVAVDQNKKAHIISEIAYKAVKNVQNIQKKVNYFDIVDGETEGYDGLSPAIYDALRNKAFHGKNSNLNWRKVVRKDKKYARIEFDPEIFIAFAYNINFEDKFYRLSAREEKWTSRDELEDKSGSESKRIIRAEQELKSEGLRPTTVIVTFRPDRFFQMNDGTKITGFHPAQVVKYFEYEDNRQKNNKHKHDDDEDDD